MARNVTAKFDTSTTSGRAAEGSVPGGHCAGGVDAAARSPRRERVRSVLRDSVTSAIGAHRNFHVCGMKLMATSSATAATESSRVRQLPRDGHGEVAAHHAERQDQNQEDDRMRGRTTQRAGRSRNGVRRFSADRAFEACRNSDGCDAIGAPPLATAKAIRASRVAARYPARGVGRPLAPRPRVETRARKPGDFHRERVVTRGDAGPAIVDDGFQARRPATSAAKLVAQFAPPA